MVSDESDGRSIDIAVNATALTIAGSDPSGGAGLQVDLKAFQQLGCYGMAVVTLITVQNSQGVRRVEVLEGELVEQQLQAVLSDIPPRAIKTGALGSAAVIEVVAEQLDGWEVPLIVDPVLISKHGDRLADDQVVEAYVEHLFPRALMVTPNRFEAEQVLGRKLATLQDMAEAAAELRSLGPQYVLLKSGAHDGKRHHMFAGPKNVVGLELDDVATAHSHGAGCALSAVIAGRLAIERGPELDESAIRAAVDFAVASVHHAVEYAPGLGNGQGPVESRLLHLGK